MIFDPNMTKKKKKKKKPFMLDEDGGDGLGEETKEVETKDAEPEGGDEKDAEFDDDDSRKKGWIDALGSSLLMWPSHCNVFKSYSSLSSSRTIG